MVQTAFHIRAIEELSFRALPALETRFYDGWLMRFANGYTRRCNSINPIFATSIELDKKIEYCESVYKKRGLNPYFKLTDQVYPDDLDSALASRGYHQEANTSVQTLSLDTKSFKSDDKVELQHRLRDTWLTNFAKLNTLSHKERLTLKKMLNIIHEPQVAYASISVKRKTAAVGLAVLDGQYVGLFDIVTAKKYRREGYAKQLVQSLLSWGKKQGAMQAYLQVVQGNEPALALYHQLGFEEAYTYWYRQCP